MPNPANSLQMLLNGGMHANDPVALAGLRASQLDEMKHNQQTAAASPNMVTGSTASDIQSLEGDIADDPNTGDAAQAEVAQQDGLRHMLFDYNRPDVAHMRNEELANKERLATAPARVTGEYNVKSAEAAGHERELVSQENAAARTAQFQAGQQGLDRRQAQTQTNMANRTELAGLQKGGHAPRPAGESLLGRMFTGPWQSDIDKARIAQLQAPSQPTAGGAGEMVTMVAPDGRVGQVPAAQVAQYEAMGAKRQ